MTAAPPAQWVTPSPLWQKAGPDPLPMRRPALLRFASDSFVSELTALLATRPGDLAERIADARTYRPRPGGQATDWQPVLPLLKLYQPAHGHFNLVAASLVCRVPGMPDRTLDVGRDESVGFVLRRLVVPDPEQPTTEAETAWVTDAAGAKGWQQVTDSDVRLVAGEQVFPLFPVHLPADRTRRLLVGLVPTSSGDSFKAAGSLSPLVADVVDLRLDEFEQRVLGALDELQVPTTTPTGMTGDALTKLVAAERKLRVEASRFLLLDLAQGLAVHAPTVWAAILAGSRPTPGPGRALYDLLESSAAEPPSTSSVRAALVIAWQQGARISGEAEPPSDLSVNLAASPLTSGALRAAITGVLPTVPPGGTTAPSPDPTATLAGEVPKIQAGARFVIRCVFSRPDCRPAPVTVMSDPSETFTIASYFDPDAPARPIRVQLPIQTSIAELRKYPKNVAFAISDQLREQMSRVTDLEKTMKGQLASGDSFDLGLLCSFSIPIITICALIVLLIFVSLLNIVFWWMPFLRICLPMILPGKKA